MRGQRNEPAFVAHIISYVASILGLPAEEVDRATAANAAALFRLPL